LGPTYGQKKPSGTIVNISKWDFFIKIWFLSLSLSPAISLPLPSALSLSLLVSPATGRGCGRDRCQKNRLGLGVTTQPSPDIGRRSSRRKMAIFARNFAGSDLPPPAAISGDQGETLSKFRQKVSVFSKWARHRGDVRNFKGFVSDFGKIRGGCENCEIASTYKGVLKVNTPEGMR
ncbi:Ribosomal RNA processing Brix domain protein, partial [Prunus dulcis]